MFLSLFTFDAQDLSSFFDDADGATVFLDNADNRGVGRWRTSIDSVLASTMAMQLSVASSQKKATYYSSLLNGKPAVHFVNPTADAHMTEIYSFTVPRLLANLDIMVTGATMVMVASFNPERLSGAFWRTYTAEGWVDVPYAKTVGGVLTVYGTSDNFGVRSISGSFQDNPGTMASVGIGSAFVMGLSSKPMLP